MYINETCLSVHPFLDFSLCDFGFDDCHVNATCIDRVGGFDCHCNEGYTGNGTHCDGMLTTIKENM